MPATHENRRIPRRLAVIGGCAVVAAAGAGAGLAAASKGGSTVLRSATVASVGAIVVDSSGRTVYALSPETTHHLLCTSSACLQIWPPETVASRKTHLKASKGVKGKLGVLRRSDGHLQLTLGGLPLYRFAGDSAPGKANGNNINSFGGHWHVIKAKAGSATAPAAGSPAPAATTTTTSSPPPYGGY